MSGKPLVLGCPKLDDGASYVQRLAQMIRVASLRSMTVLHMEVPCCTALLRIAESAAAASRAGIPVRSVTISTSGRER
jgi:hypothetical protein